MSQQALADVIHVTQQSVYKYENGLAQPELDILIACAKFFDTSVDYLINYSDIPQRYENVNPNSLTTEEHRLLEFYRQLPKQSQNFVQDIISVKKDQ